MSYAIHHQLGWHTLIPNNLISQQKKGRAGQESHSSNASLKACAASLTSWGVAGLANRARMCCNVTLSDEFMLKHPCYSYAHPYYYYASENCYIMLFFSAKCCYFSHGQSPPFISCDSSKSRSCPTSLSLVGITARERKGLYIVHLCWGGNQSESQNRPLEMLFFVYRWVTKGKKSFSRVKTSGFLGFHSVNNNPS